MLSAAISLTTEQVIPDRGEHVHHQHWNLSNTALRSTKM
jgi:hypothetical protein